MEYARVKLQCGKCGKTWACQGGKSVQRCQQCNCKDKCKHFLVIPFITCDKCKKGYTGN